MVLARALGSGDHCEYNHFETYTSLYDNLTLGKGTRH